MPINYANSYPTDRGFVRGIVSVCTNQKIILADGRIFDFPFPAGGLRTPLEAGTVIAIKVSEAGRAKEYYVLEYTAQVQTASQDRIEQVLSEE